MSDDALNKTVRFARLPDRQRFHELIDQVFDSGWVTNHGHCARKLEDGLRDRFGTEHVVLTSNGTMALQIACRLLGLRGKVITTPASYVATVNAQLWEGLQPVFVDVDPADGNISPEGIEAAVDGDVSAIMPVHLYGNPCAIDRITEIADAHSLAVVYDAAACFGVTYNKIPVVRYGDVSALSFHATKIFSTVEGGALVINNEALYQRARMMVTHGINANHQPAMIGTNARMSELHAAYGLCALAEIDDILNMRRDLTLRLRERLRVSTRISFPSCNPRSAGVLSYFPMLFPSENEVHSAMRALAARGYESQRYFYPPLNQLPYVGDHGACPYAEDFTRRVLCLPISNSLTDNVLDDLASAIIGALDA